MLAPEFDLIDPPRHAFGLHDGSDSDHQDHSDNSKTPCSALQGENGPEEDDDPTGKIDFGSIVGRSTGRRNCKEACIVCVGSSSLRTGLCSVSGSFAALALSSNPPMVIPR